VLNCLVTRIDATQSLKLPSRRSPLVNRDVFRNEQTSFVAWATLLYAIRSLSGILAVGADRYAGGHNALQAGDTMDTSTLLIILVVLLVLGGGGFFYRRRIRLGR
jgi:LPXTG-motif cell wall-anchored protein